MHVIFQKDCWSTDGLVYTGSARFAAMPEFCQQADYIENIPTPVSPDGYAYTTLITKEKLRPDVTIRTHCTFEQMAAPLFVMAKELKTQDGKLFYSDYLEVVAWKNGINVWELWQDESGTVQIRSLLELKIPLQTGRLYDFSLRITKDRFKVGMDDLAFELYCDKIYDAFHLGFIGCEGPCRFYNLQIEKE